MPRIDYLPRTGMYEEAFKFAFANKALFPFTYEYYKETYNTFIKNGSGSCKEYALLRKMYEMLDEWLNENYLLYYCDMTHPDDNGSREEVVLVVKKPEENTYSHYGDNFMYYHPDLTKEVVACFWR